MFWLIKKSKKKKNLYNLTKNTILFKLTTVGLVTKKTHEMEIKLPKFRKHRLVRSHLGNLRKWRKSIVSTRSPLFYFSDRSWMYQRFWRKIFIRRTKRRLLKKRLLLKGWRARFKSSRTLYGGVPLVLVPLAKPLGLHVTSGGLLVKVQSYSLGTDTAQYVGMSLLPGVNPSPITKGSFGKHRKTWKIVTMGIRAHFWDKQKTHSRFVRQRRALNKFVRRRTFLWKRKHSYKIPMSGLLTQLVPTHIINQRAMRLHDRPYGSTKPLNITTSNNVSFVDKQKATMKGKLMRSNSALRHFYEQNVARAFEFENWYFWEEFIPTKDHSKQLTNWAEGRVRVVEHLKKKNFKRNKQNIFSDKKHKGIFMYNRRWNRHQVRLYFFLDKLVKKFTIDKLIWRDILKLLHLLLQLVIRNRSRLNNESIVLTKRVMYLITELDYLVISRIESDLLPSYRMDRSAKRGYTTVRTRFKDFHQCIKRLSALGDWRLEHGKYQHIDIKKTSEQQLFSRAGYLCGHRIYEKKKRIKKILHLSAFFAKKAHIFLKGFWSRDLRFSFYMNTRDEDRWLHEISAMHYYYRLFPGRRFWIFNHIRFIRLILKEKIRKGTNNWIKKFKLKPSPTGMGFRNIKKKYIRTDRVGKCPILKRRTVLAKKQRPITKVARKPSLLKELVSIKKKLPKFRVRIKMRNIKLRGFIKKIKPKHWQYHRAVVYTGLKKKIAHTYKLERNLPNTRPVYKNDYQPHTRTINMPHHIDSAIIKKIPTTPVTATGNDWGDYLRTVSVSKKKIEYKVKAGILPPKAYMDRTRLSMKFKTVRLFANRFADVNRWANPFLKNQTNKIMRYWVLLKSKITKKYPIPAVGGLGILKNRGYNKYRLNLKKINLPRKKYCLGSTSKNLNKKYSLVNTKGGSKLNQLIRVLETSYTHRIRRKKKKWLSPESRAASLSIRRDQLSMGLGGLSLKVIASIGIKKSFLDAITILNNSIRVLKPRDRRFFNKHKYIFTLILLMAYMDVSIWTSYLNRLFFRTKFFRQRKLFHSLRCLLPRAAITCGLNAPIMGMYMSFKGKVASRGGLRKRVLRASHGWYTSANFGIQYKYKFKQIWSKSGAIGLKTIITCGNTHINRL